MRKTAGGFTLVEVLVALAVLAFALTAIFKNMAQAVDVSAELRDRTVSLWVAQDLLALRRIEGAAPPAGTRSGEQDSADARWNWTETTQEAGNNMRSVEIVVTRVGSDREKARLSTLMVAS